MSVRMIPRPRIGDIVCDCRMIHSRVVAFADDRDDMIILEDGFRCSWVHCCDTVPHEWVHPDIDPVVATRHFLR